MKRLKRLACARVLGRSVFVFCVWVWEKDDVDSREEGGQFILEVGQLMHAIDKVTRPAG